MHVIYGRSYPDHAALVARVAELDAEWAGRNFSAKARSEWNALNEAIAESEREVRRDRLAELYRSGGGREPGGVARAARTTASTARST